MDSLYDRGGDLRRLRGAVGRSGYVVGDGDRLEASRDAGTQEESRSSVASVKIADLAAAYRTQADALEIEAGAKRRLADEYDAAQERGEILSNGERTFSSPEKMKGTDVIPPKDLHEARAIRDAEVAEPGIVRAGMLTIRTAYSLDGQEVPPTPA